MTKKKRDTESNKNGATLGFEATLFQSADKLRNTLMPPNTNMWCWG